MRKTVCVAALLLAVVLLLNACIPSTPTPAPRVEISLSEVVVKVGESIELSATSTNGETILWTSANEGVATVSDGIVFGKEEGEVVITASTRTALATCLVRVVGGNPPEDDPSTDPNPDPSHGLEGLTLVWSDEFSGSELDRSKWGFQIGVRDEYHGKLGNTW